MTVSERGTGQGSVISPLLANIYLHYAFDLWANRWRQREATGEIIVVRYADDGVVGFEHAAGARRFLDMMRARLEEFALTLHPEKAPRIEYGRHPAARREKRRAGRAGTFNFLGFTMFRAGRVPTAINSYAPSDATVDKCGPQWFASWIRHCFTSEALTPDQDFSAGGGRAWKARLWRDGPRRRRAPGRWSR
ncbi:MAG: reverse transcriptase domain-containing protein [Acetobacteraceae bacterium]